MAKNGIAVAVAFAETVRTWTKIDLLGCGGPAGQIAMMHKMLAEEKQRDDEDRFLYALNYCMLLPGAEAQQLAILCFVNRFKVRQFGSL